MTKVLWMDLETTGLDPEVHSIIEVGAIVTDDQFTMYDQYNYIMAENPSWKWGQFALAMHEQNGLLDKCREYNRGRLYECEHGLIKLVKDHTDKPMIIAGNSIHFDRKFIAKHMPEFNSLLHYRMIDVSGMNEAYRIFKGLNLPKVEPKHRVMDDIQDSIKLGKILMGLVTYEKNQ